jgi:hypothetical protein
MGEEKTPKSFRAACTVFTNLEVLLDQDEEGTGGGAIGKEVIEQDIASIILENDDKNKATGLGEIGNRLVKKYSDFDVRNYGYSSLSKFLEEMDNFELRKSNNVVTVRIKDNRTKRQELDDYAVKLVKGSGKSGMELAALGNGMHRKFADFKVKDYGYSTFSKFVHSISSLEVRENKNNSKAVFLK